MGLLGDKTEIPVNILTLFILLTYVTSNYFSCQQMKLTRESIESVQRAFISFDVLHLTPMSATEDNPSPLWQLGIDAQNNGTTPALTVVSHFNAEDLFVEPDGEDFTGSPGHVRTDTIEIGAKATQEINGPDKPSSFLFGENGKHVQGQLPFFWGWIAYRDVFPKTPPHVTEFCRVAVKAGYTLPAGSVPHQLKMDLRSCFRHNCTDRNCQDYDKVLELAYSKKR